MGKPRNGEYTQASRIHMLVRLIGSRRGITLNEMAEHAGVDRRTIHRDLNAIQAAGYALDSGWVGSEKVYHFDAGHSKAPPVAFTLNEIMALYLMKSQAGVFATTPVQRDIDEVFSKLTSVLPARHAVHLERISRVAVPKLAGTCDYSGQQVQIAAVYKGLLHQHKIIISYAKQGKTADDYSVDPYSLVSYRGALYLLGYAHNRGAIRIFALDRIRVATVCEERFEVPEAFNAEGLFAETFGIVSEEPVSIVIQFNSATKHLVAGRNWHPAQLCCELPDGSLRLSFQASGMAEVVAWLAGYGGGVKVLEPPALAKMMVAHARAMIAAQEV